MHRLSIVIASSCVDLSGLLAGDDIQQLVAVQGLDMQAIQMMHPTRGWGTGDLGELPPELCPQRSSTGHGHSPVEGSFTDCETDADYLSILLVCPILLHAIHHILMSIVMQPFLENLLSLGQHVSRDFVCKKLYRVQTSEKHLGSFGLLGHHAAMCESTLRSTLREICACHQHGRLRHCAGGSMHVISSVGMVSACIMLEK